MSAMRAVHYESTGPARDVLRIGQLEQPTPSLGEVLVRVIVSGVNPSDVKSRAGGRAPLMYPSVIPHSDGAGLIEDVGPGVDRRRIGERVWIWNGQWKRPFGTAAEYIALPSTQAVPLPDGVPFHVGASLGVPWLTAWRAVRYRPLVGVETVLISGGAGAVGLYAIQLAKRAGFRVVSTVSSPEKADLATSRGADLVIDYKHDDVAAAVSSFTDGQGVDRIIEVDLAGNASLYPKLLRKDGLVITYGSHDWSSPLPLAEWLLHGLELAIFIVYEISPEIRARAIAESQIVLCDPTFQHPDAVRFPLEQIVEAHEAVESGTTMGKVVIDLELSLHNR
jgi:NADPH2:quinone reductase